MLTMMFTHNLNNKLTRRFFVNPSMRDLIKALELEIWRIPRTTNQSLSDWHTYVRMRIQALPIGSYEDFIDLEILEALLLDCVDVNYYRLYTRLYPFTMPYRMYKYSEPLAIDLHKENGK